MKTNQILAIFLLLLFVTACNTGSDTGYTIKGDISGLPEGAHIQLVSVSHVMELPLAEMLVVDGKFKLNGSVDQPTAVIIKVKDGHGSKYMMLENGVTKIEGEIKSSITKGDLYYDFSNLTVSGSPATDKYLELMSVRSEMDKMHAAYIAEHKDVMDAMNKARVEKNQQAIDSIEAGEAYSSMAESEKMFFTTVETRYEQIIMDNKDSYWGPLMMITLMSYFNDDTKLWYEQLTPEAKESYYGQKVFEELYPAGSLGTQVPEFNVTGNDGTETSFSELRQGKKYILIDFWASWCNPCIKEIPNLKVLYNKYASQGFEIVSISIDERENDWVKKSEEVQLPWPSYLDRNAIAGLYQVRVIPTTYLVDENGVLVAENPLGENLESKLAELFAAP